MPAEHTCPVCDETARNGSELRVHLMVEHRKSDLAELVVSDVSRSGEHPALA